MNTPNKGGFTPSYDDSIEKDIMELLLDNHADYQDKSVDAILHDDEHGIAEELLSKYIKSHSEYCSYNNEPSDEG